MNDIIPHSNEIERAVLGAMLINDEAIIKAMELITTETFYKPVNQIIFKAIVDIYSSGIPIDGFTVSEHLKINGQFENIGGEAAIAALMAEATTSANIEYHCKIIKEKAALRKLIALSKSVENSCYENGAEPQTLSDSLMLNLFEIKNKEKNRQYSTMMEMTLEAHEEIMKRINAKDELFGIPTGFHKLDVITDGWQNGDLIIIAGLTASGKTTLALNLARNAAIKNSEIAIFSMEMPKNQLGKRFIGMESRMNVRRKNYTENEIRIIGDASARQSHYPIFTDDSSGLTHQSVYAKMKVLKNEQNIKLVIIDHLQLMAGTPEFKGNRRLQIEEITRHMKGYAKDLSIPIILLSQLSRDPDKQNRRPKLSDLRESGSIEQDADVVIFIYEPAPKVIVEKLANNGKTVTEEQSESIVEIIIGKQRNGPTGSFYLYRHKEYTLFDDLEY